MIEAWHLSWIIPLTFTVAFVLGVVMVTWGNDPAPQGGQDKAEQGEKQ